MNDKPKPPQDKPAPKKEIKLDHPQGKERFDALLRRAAKPVK